MWAINSGCRFRAMAINSLSLGWSVRLCSSKTVDAHSGNKPTSDLTWSRVA